VEWYDAPTVRRIEFAARTNNYRLNDFIFGVVKSDAFRMRKVVAEQPTKTAPASSPASTDSKAPAARRGR
jgi:hypothetical protein